MALPYDASLQSVRVIGHLKNRVDDFPSVLADVFEARGLHVSWVISDRATPGPGYVVTYDVCCSWLIIRYLSWAQVVVYKDGEPVASGTYRYRHLSLSLDVVTRFFFAPGEKRSPCMMGCWRVIDWGHGLLRRAAPNGYACA